MYKIVSITLLMLMTTSLFAQFKPGDVGFRNEDFEVFKKNKVKTQSQIFLDTDSITALLSVSTYSEAGWLLTITYQDAESYYIEEEEAPETVQDEYTYYPDGKIRLRTLYGYDLYPIVMGYEYDKKDKLIASVIASAEAREFNYEHDKSGNIIKRTGKSARFAVDSAGNSLDTMIMVETESYEYTWNKNGTLASELFKMYNEFYYFVKYTYNANKQLIDQSVYYDSSPEATPTYKTTYTYSENGLLLKMITEEEGYWEENLYEYTYYE